MQKYPTGVENHGGNLRLWFIYQGKRVRENLSVPDTPKNRKIAGELRSSICYAIKTGAFNYAMQFPESPNLSKFGFKKENITIGELADNWLSLKEMEITFNAIKRYRSYIRITTDMLGTDRLVSSVTNEMILSIRKELLTGYQISGHMQTNRRAKKGRTVRTVNVYMTCLFGMFEFATCNGYISKTPFSGVSPLRKSKSEPDPLNKDEYIRLLNASPSNQVRNIWQLAINTGMRHGEICALAWEDIDTKEWTITISRNMAVVGYFTPPKTESSNRTIKLTTAAISALKEQMTLTRFGEQHKIEVHLREFGRTRTDDCTFVFLP